MFIASLYRLVKDQLGLRQGGRRRRPRRASFRPRLTALEERCLLDAGFQEFLLPTANSLPSEITRGADGNLWFTESANKIGRITPTGALAEFAVPTANSQPDEITAGPDGSLWFTERSGNKIGRITPAGAITEFAVPTANSGPAGITAGADGNLWFTEYGGDLGNSKIGKISPTGTVTEFPLSANSRPVGITAGADGNLWFTESNANKIGRITPAGAITTFFLPFAPGTLDGNNVPSAITAGPDGNLWFTEAATDQVGRITTAGSVTQFTVSINLSGITAGPDGNVWFTVERTSNIVGRITPAGVVTSFTVPTANSNPVGITAGPDGSIWFTELGGNKIGRLILPTYLSVTPAFNPVPAGAASSVTVKALDPYNTVAINYRGTVHFTSTDPTASLPADYTFTAADNGVHTFTVTLRTTGTQSVVVTDAAQPALKGAATSTQEFTALTVAGGPNGITAGPDGNLWFTEVNSAKIGRITPTGAITEFPVPISSSAPYGITRGPDGNLWFTELGGNKIGRITPTGALTEFAVPTADSRPNQITAGPDGNLWFTELNGNKVGRITPAGTITEFAVPTTNSGLNGITAGPDGNLWFTEVNTNKVGKITSAGAVTEFTVPTASSGSYRITAGPDGNLWFTEYAGNKVGRITPAGAITEFPVPTAGSSPYGITAGPDGNLWFTEAVGNKLGRIAPAGAITEFAVPTPNSYSLGITAGPDSNLWFTESAVNKIGQLRPGITVMSGPPASLSLSPSAGTVTAGAAFTVTVTALDQFGNIVTGYTGTVHFTSSDGQATLPANYSFAAADHGVHTFTGLILRTAGSQTITAQDTVSSGLNKTIGLTVTPVAADHYSVSAPAGSVAGTPFSVTVRALDPYGNTATGYTGTVFFSSPDSQATLPANYAFNTADRGVHTFTGVALRTAGNQSIIAKDTVNPLINGMTGVTVTPAAADHFTVSAPAGSVAGTPFSVTVRAFDPYGNIATGYTGTVHPTSSDSQATLPADYPFTAADQGVHTLSGVALRTAGNQTITAQDTGSTSISGTTGVVVSSAAADHFTVSAPAGAVAGAPFSVTVTALDLFGNTATGYTGTVTFASSDGQAALPGNYAFTAVDQGAHIFTGVALRTAGNQTITAQDTVSTSISGTTGVVVSSAAADHFTVSAPAGAVAGAPFSVTVTALDPFNNSATGYTGTVHLASPDGRATFPADYAFTAADQGVHTFTGVVLGTAGSQTIIARDTVSTSLIGTTGVTVTPAAADHFTVRGPDGSVAGAPFIVTVNALDPFGNTATGYTGTVTLASSDSQATFPADYAFTAADQGVHTFIGVVLRTAGSQTITAQDTVSTSINGTTGVAVTPAAADHFTVSAPAGSVAGTPFSVTVTAFDPYGNAATGYTGTVHLLSPDGWATFPADYAFTAADQGVHTFTGVVLGTAGSQLIIAQDTVTNTTGNAPVLVTPAAADHFVLVAVASVAAGTPFDVTVVALDSYGNVDVNYRGTVTFTTTDADPGVVLPVDYIFTAGDGGMHTFTGACLLMTPGDQVLTALDTANGLSGNTLVTVQ
jgi:streptogramin lyase